MSGLESVPEPAPADLVCEDALVVSASLLGLFTQLFQHAFLKLDQALTHCMLALRRLHQRVHQHCRLLFQISPIQLRGGDPSLVTAFQRCRNLLQTSQLFSHLGFVVGLVTPAPWLVMMAV